jgi:3alpha(or 20beta)-hydroxysteroid dehydrogenase
MARLSGKVAIVTGAARGQGEAEARLFAREGAQVVLADVLDDEGEAVAKDIGGAATYVHVDVSQEQDWKRAIDAAASFGPLNVLVNNAAISGFGSIEETSLDDYMRVVNINQVGTFLGIKSAIPAMTAAGAGSIVNISSIDGIGSKNGLVAYTSSKFAIRGMTKTAALELGHRGIRVNSIHPGGINTIMGNPMGWEGEELQAGWRTRVALGRIGEPIDIANMALFLASDEASYCTGAEFVVDGGWTCGDIEPLLPGAPF